MAETDVVEVLADLANTEVCSYLSKFMQKFSQECAGFRVKIREDNKDVQRGLFEVKIQD